MSNTPSKAEIEVLVKRHGATSYRNRADTQHPAYGFTEDGLNGLIDEVLAKWGTPHRVNLGFTIENRAGIDVLVWKDGGCQPATSAEVAMWKALAAVQQPVVREPLTDEQLAEMMRDTWGCASIAPRHALEFARTVERAHGIPQKGCD